LDSMHFLQSVYFDRNEINVGGREEISAMHAVIKHLCEKNRKTPGFDGQE